MEENEVKETFAYSYSAKEQEEVEKIRRKYVPKEEDKMETLRRLDQSVTVPGTVVSIIVGVIGTLVFGLGMCCVLEWKMLLAGIIIGIIGAIGIALAYPICIYLNKKQREKVAPQIIKLAAELKK